MPAIALKGFKSLKKKGPEQNSRPFDFGVADGARTHDNRNHNPGLYQLSYSHRSKEIITSWPDGAAYCAAVVESSFLATGLLTLNSALKRCLSVS
jgi:hypothetical protein